MSDAIFARVMQICACRSRLKHGRMQHGQPFSEYDGLSSEDSLVSVVE